MPQSQSIQRGHFRSYGAIKLLFDPSQAIKTLLTNLRERFHIPEQLVAFLILHKGKPDNVLGTFPDPKEDEILNSEKALKDYKVSDNSNFFEFVCLSVKKEYITVCIDCNPSLVFLESVHVYTSLRVLQSKLKSKISDISQQTFFLFKKPLVFLDESRLLMFLGEFDEELIFSLGKIDVFDHLEPILKKNVLRNSFQKYRFNENNLFA